MIPKVARRKSLQDIRQEVLTGMMLIAPENNDIDTK